MSSFELPEDPIATGRTAQVFAYGEGRIVKLLLPGFDAASLTSEARKADTANQAGVVSPAVVDDVEIDGRPGIVFEFVDGDELLDEITFEPMRLRHWAQVFADAHIDVLSHKAADLPPVTEVLHARISQAGLSSHAMSVVLSQLDVLSGGDSILHGDFHPGNVILGKDGPVVIDWVDAARGAPAADIARTAWLMSPATVSDMNPNRRLMTTLQGSFRRTYLRRVMRALGVNKKELTAWRLPVVAARISEGIEAEDDALRAEVERLVSRV